jgi:hypothetical protein
MIFTNGAGVLSHRSNVPNKINTPKLRHWRTSQKLVTQRVAPNWLHTPVDHLHSIEKSEDTIPQFSLTLKMKGVQRHSFFDSF